MMYKYHILKNGLKIAVKPIRHLNSMTLGMWIGVGGRFENRKNSGISHYLEHMIFKGSRSRSTDAIKRAIEGLGGTLNGFTGEECTCYWAKMLGVHQEVAFSVLSDMIMDPRLSEKEMKKEKTVILEEIKMYKDLPQHYVHELLDEILWPGQPLSMPLTGSLESVSSMKREELLRFKERWYNPRNIIIAAVGAVDEERIVSDAERLCFPSTKGKQPGFKKVDFTRKSPAVKFRFKETEQTHLALGIYGLSRFDPDRYILALINIILGANMSSRLFTEVREKRGLAYEIVSHMKEYKDTGLFSISAGIDNRKVVRAAELIIKELSRIKRVPVKGEELSRAKEFYRGQFLMMIEESLNYMVWLGDKLIGSEELLACEDILKKVERVTPEDIKRVANRIFKRKNLKAALIGPLKEGVAANIRDLTESLR